MSIWESTIPQLLYTNKASKLNVKQLTHVKLDDEEPFQNSKLNNVD